MIRILEKKESQKYMAFRERRRQKPLDKEILYFLTCNEKISMLIWMISSISTEDLFYWKVISCCSHLWRKNSNSCIHNICTTLKTKDKLLAFFRIHGSIVMRGWAKGYDRPLK